MLELDEIVRQVLAFEISHVVLTGGEPMLFDAIVPLAEALRNRGKITTIETAGTIFRDLPCDLMSISPKLSGSAPDESSAWRDRHENARLNLDVLRGLTEKYTHQLKFVVNPEVGDEIGEILALLAELDESIETVMIMAEGRDAETLHRRERLLVPICMKYDFCLTPRFHIDLFGDTRGT